MGLADKLIPGLERLILSGPKLKRARSIENLLASAAEKSLPRQSITRLDDLFRGEGLSTLSVSKDIKSPYIVRQTADSQIDDIIKSGVVRPKVGGYGKAQKSTVYFGESNYAKPGMGDMFQGGTASLNESKNVMLVADSSVVKSLKPGEHLRLDQLKHIWRRNPNTGEITDVLQETLSRNIEINKLKNIEMNKVFKRPQTQKGLIQGIRRSHDSQYSIFNSIIHPEVGFPGGALQPFLDAGETFYQYFLRMRTDVLQKFKGLELELEASEATTYRYPNLLKGYNEQKPIVKIETFEKEYQGMFRPAEDLYGRSAIRVVIPDAKAEIIKHGGSTVHTEFHSPLLGQVIDLKNPVHRSVISTFRHEFTHAMQYYGLAPYKATDIIGPYGKILPISNARLAYPKGSIMSQTQDLANKLLGLKSAGKVEKLYSKAIEEAAETAGTRSQAGFHINAAYYPPKEAVEAALNTSAAELEFFTESSTTLTLSAIHKAPKFIEAGVYGVNPKVIKGLQGSKYISNVFFGHVPRGTNFKGNAILVHMPEAKNSKKSFELGYEFLTESPHIHTFVEQGLKSPNPFVLHNNATGNSAFRKMAGRSAAVTNNKSRAMRYSK